MKNEDPIAIVGIGCRFPGNASGPDKYWRMLCEGKDAICDIPKDRWDPRRFYDPDPEMPGKTYMKKEAFLKSRSISLVRWRLGSLRGRALRWILSRGCCSK